MRRTVSFLSILLITSAHAATAQDAKLVGTWKFDAGRSEGLPPGLQLSLAIREAGDTAIVETRVTTPQGPVVLSDTILLTGVEFAYTYRRANGMEGRGRRTARRTSTGLALSDSVSIDTQIGPAARTTTANWIVDASAGTLTQDITVTQQFFVTPVKYVFVRGNQ